VRPDDAPVTVVALADLVAELKDAGDLEGWVPTYAVRWTEQRIKEGKFQNARSVLDWLQSLIEGGSVVSDTVAADRLSRTLRELVSRLRLAEGGLLGKNDLLGTI